MPTEAWFRNPHSYVRELVESGESRVAWDRGMLIKKSIDPIKHADLYFGTALPWRLLAIGPQGTAEYKNGDTWERPTAVYPTWEYGEDPAILLDMIEHPAGENRDACNNRHVEGDERPVWGQQHRVVITELPNSTLATSRNFLRWLKEVQEDNPGVIIHLHGLYSFRLAFGLGFGAADVEPRFDAQKGKVVLPSGKIEKWEATRGHPQWVTNLGFLPADLEVPRNRCIYNIKSAVWASQNYEMMFNFRGQRSSAPVDTETPDDKYSPPTTKSPLIGTVTFKPGDKQLCDTCSVQDQCRVFRTGAVCSLPDAEPASLAKMFKSRDADTIVDALGTLMAAGANRFEKALATEEFIGDIDPEVTKMGGQLFKQGESLAKLLDPNLRGGTKVNIGVNGNAAVQVTSGSPKVLIAGIVRTLEAQGVPRDKQTPEMIQNILAAMGGNGVSQQTAIEGTVVASQTETA